MDQKSCFNELMKQRHSSRYFQSKEIPEEVLKQIISTSLKAPSWCNAQPWNIYVASGNTLSEIRKTWISKNSQKIKGYADMNPGHRTDYSERGQKLTAILYQFADKTVTDPKSKNFMDVQYELFNAPTMVYLTIPKGSPKYSILDTGALEMAILLSARANGVDSIPAYETIKYPDVIKKH